MELSPQLAKFLDLIAWSEGTSTSKITLRNGYDAIVSGPAGPEVFRDYSQHPFENRPPKLVCGPTPKHPGGIYSTASGRYQILRKYWDDYRAILKLPDFGPASQDAAAVQQIRERHAIELIEAGDIDKAIAACSNIWASLPGNNYEQAPHPMEALLAKWDELATA